MKIIDLNDALSEYENFVKAEKGLSNQTWKAYFDDISIFLHKMPEYYLTSDLDEEDLFVFTNESLSDGLSISTVARRLSSLRNFYIFLRQNDFINFDLPNVELPKKPERLPNCLTVDEVDDLLNAPNLEKKSEIRDKAMLETMYATGIRVSELLALKKGDIDFNERILTVHNGKGGKDRKVPIGEFACEFLLKYIKEVRNKNPGKKTDALFLNNSGKPLSRIYFFRQVKKYAEMVGIGINVSPHTLRHCFASHLIEQGAGIRVVQEMLGHCNISTTQIYTHVNTKRIISVYDTLLNKK